MKKYAFVIDNTIIRIKNSETVPDIIPDNSGSWVDVTDSDVVLGSIFSKEYNRFIPPKMYESWVYNPDINNWVPPIPAPDNGVLNHWDESSKSWKIT